MITLKKAVSISFLFSLMASQAFARNYIYSAFGENQIHAEQCSDALNGIGQLTEDWNEDINQKNEIREAYELCLGHYIRIKTVSPKGEEKQAVDYLKHIFDEIKIANKIIKVEDLTGLSEYRYNLVATLPAKESYYFDWSKKTNRKSIILLNHMDVVDTHPEQWQAPDLDFSGEIAPDETGEMYIWGRGTLDMKGIAIVQLFNMWLVKKLDIPMERDLHFLAVADEEQSASGAIGVLRKMQIGEELEGLASANLLLNEGGGGAKDLPVKNHNLFLVAAEEKGGAWLDIEHTDPLKLLKNLYKSKILQINKYIRKVPKKIKGHGCELTKAHTPNAKVNVIASKLNIEFKCKEGFQAEALFKSVFEHGFKTIVAKAKQEKNHLKMELTSASSSHGSIGLNESLMTAFVMGLYKLDILKIKKNKKLPNYFRYVKTPATSLLIKELGKTKKIIRYVNALRFIPYLKRLLLKELEGEFGVDGWFKTTCEFSAFNFNTKASALVDCRLLHTGVKGEQNQSTRFIGELNKKINDKNNKINLIDGWDFSSSSALSSDFKTLRKSLKSFSGSDGKVVVVPFLFPAGSDSSFFRNPWTAGSNINPIPSFGFFPVYLTPELLGAMHGANERFPVKEIVPTIYRYQHTLSNLLATEGN